MEAVCSDRVVDEGVASSEACSSEKDSGERNEAELMMRFFATISQVPAERRSAVYRSAIAAAKRSAAGLDIEGPVPHSLDPVFLALARGIERTRPLLESPGLPSLRLEGRTVSVP